MIKKRNRKAVFAGVFSIIGILCLIGAGVLTLLVYSPAKAIEASETLVYIILGLLALSLVLLGVGLLLIVSNSRARGKEEEKLVRDIEDTATGKRALIEENGNYFVRLARSINRSHLLRNNTKHAYGVYRENKFDSIVLETLEKEVTAKAGLAYFILVGETPIKTKGPRDALLYMLRAHFGESVYYGVLRQGIAVFAPVLSSKEEFMGKVRRTVQLFSYSEEENHISGKAGVGFYPDFAPRLLTAEAMKATMEGLALNVHAKEEMAPHLGYEAAEEEAFLLHKNNFLKRMNEATSSEALDADYASFVKLALPYVYADSLGVALFKKDEGVYELLTEASTPEGRSFGIAASNGKLPKGLVEPLYEWSIKEKGYVIASDTIFLSDPLCVAMGTLGVSSIAVLSVSEAGSPLALVYAGAKQKNRFESNRAVIEFLDVSRSYVLSRSLLREKELGHSREDILLSSFDHYAYGVAKDSFNLSYVSPNLHKANPEAKVGKVCYEALFGLKKPCTHCPLLENGVEKMMPRLASGVFAYKAVVSEGQTMLILSPHKADFSPSRLDPNTGLLSDKSLHEDLQNEILLKDSVGVILAFRIRNVDAIARLVRLPDYEEVVKAVSDALSSVGLARGLYRNGIAGFAYLLPFASRADGLELAEKISRKFSEKILFHDREIEFVFDYVLISYPLEAETPFALDAILRVLYQRADASSRGRLYEVENEKGRLVDIDYYMRTKLEEGLRAKHLPVAFTHYDELSGKHTAFLEASLTLEDEVGGTIKEKTVFAAAKALEREKEVLLATINTVARFLGEKRKEIASTPLRGVIVKINPSAFSEGFLDGVTSMLENNKANKKHLYLQVDEDDTKSKVFSDFKRAARTRGIQLGLSNYKGDLESHVISDFAYISIPAAVIHGYGKKSFLLSLGNVRRAGVNVLVDGYRDNEERRYLGSLTFHYGKKEDEVPVKEEDITF